MEEMIGPNVAKVKVAESMVRDDIQRADRARACAEARAVRERRSVWATITGALRSRPEPAFTRSSQVRRRAVTTVG